MVVRQATSTGDVRVEGWQVQAFPLGSVELTWDVFEHDRPTDANELTRLLGRPLVHGHAFIARTPQSVVAIDAGMQSGGPFDGLRGALNDNAIDENEIDLVLVTHLHPDHAGGLLNGLYPNATVVVPDAELAFASDLRAIRSANEWVRRDYTSAPAVVDAIRDRLVPLSQATLPAGLTVRALPGHSPGHTGYLLNPDPSTSAAVLFAGDLLHVPELQLHRPDLAVLADFDPIAAARTREATLQWLAGSGTILAAAHVGPSPFTRVLAV